MFGHQNFGPHHGRVLVLLNVLSSYPHAMLYLARMSLPILDWRPWLK